MKELSAQDRKTIGEDIKTMQFGWPLGMPLVDHLAAISGGFSVLQQYTEEAIHNKPVA
ncbi:MAG: hypothetical protein WC856_28515 [Methylococcaceae bacterium]